MSNNSYEILKFCRCCGSSVEEYLDLGMQPMANNYQGGKDQEKFPLKVNLCTSCFHSQLSIVVKPELMYKHYLYVNTAETFKQHCRQLAKDTVKFFDKKIKVLDIACNNGDLLSYFRDLGCEVHGVDPAENLRELTKKKGIDVEVDYWNGQLASKMPKFDIITGTNVFAHVNDIADFIQACGIALAENGIVVLEFPYYGDTLRHNEFDQVYFEHLSYFLAYPFSKFVRKYGFYIEDLVRTDIHGGSIRFILKYGEKDHCKKLYDLLDEEKEFLTKQAYLDFVQRIKNNMEVLVNLVNSLKKSGKVIGYGASAKGCTVLNFTGISLDYVVDDNEMKYNYTIPGTDIKIYSPKVLIEEDNLNIVMLAWNFSKEIIGRVKKLRPNKKDIFISYIPQINLS